MTYLYKIIHADTCQLAHELTLKELTEKGKAHEIDIQPTEEEGGSYILHVQEIFERYVNMIEHYMLYDNITKDTLNIDISEEDAYDIINGKSFKWSYETERHDLSINVNIN